MNSPKKRTRRMTAKGPRKGASALKGASMEPVRVQSGLVAEQLAITGAASLMVARDNSAPQVARGFLAIKNMHATNILYIGPNSGVTTANGYSIDPGKEVILAGAHMYVGDIYGIGSGALTACVLRY